MDTSLFITEHGRPSDKRIPAEEASYDLLDSLGISYERIDHDPTASMEECEAIGAALGVRICKNLFLCNRQKTAFYLLLMPGDKEFRTKDLSKQINSARLSFADENYMKEFLSVQPGSVSILGLMNDSGHKVTLLIDRDVLKEEYFGCHPCKNSSSIRLLTSELTEKLIPALNKTPVIVDL